VKATLSLHWTVIGCCGLIITLTTGCIHWIELKPAADSSQEPNVRLIARDEQVPLVMDSVGITHNGSPQNLSPETEQRVLGMLSEMEYSHTLAARNPPSLRPTKNSFAPAYTASSAPLLERSICSDSVKSKRS